MNELTLASDYKIIPKLRESFYDFIKEVFPSADFREWFGKGYWSDKFIPYSLHENGKIVSNVCISKMKLIIDDEEINAIQIGAVGTLPEYRNNGLSGYLMDLALNKYRDSSNLIFLFANETVTEFYPKFGFKQYQETIYKSTSPPPPQYSARKMDISKEDDLNLIFNMAKKRSLLTKTIGAVDYEFITMWHVLNIYRNDIYYLEDPDVIIIATVENGCLNLWDVIYTKPFNLMEVMPKVIQNEISSITYHFAPDILNFNYSTTEKSDTLLFIRGDFKLSGKEFKFPVTAQT